MTAYELVCAERAIRDRAYLSSFRERRRLMRLADDLQTIRETLADCDAERRDAALPPAEREARNEGLPPELLPRDLCMDDTGRPR